MELNIKYICIAANKGGIYTFVDKDNCPITIPIDNFSSVDEYHKVFLNKLQVSPKYLEPVLLDVYIEEGEFNIYYGVLLPLDFPLNVEGFTFVNAKTLELDKRQLSLIYLTSAKGIMP
jgi:hypothetical protein